MLLTLTQRDGKRAMVNTRHIATIETIHAHAREMSVIVFTVSQHNGQPKTLMVQEDIAKIETLYIQGRRQEE